MMAVARSARRAASSTALRASVAAIGAGSYWAGALNRSSCASWRAACRPSSPAVASSPTASSCPPPDRCPSSAPQIASQALMPAVPALPSATSQRSAARLSCDAASQLRDFARYAVASALLTGCRLLPRGMASPNELPEIGASQCQRVLGNRVPEPGAGCIVPRRIPAAQVGKVVVENLNAVTAKDPRVRRELGQARSPALPATVFWANGEKVNVACGVSVPACQRSEQGKAHGLRVEAASKFAQLLDPLASQASKASHYLPGRISPLQADEHGRTHLSPTDHAQVGERAQHGRSSGAPHSGNGRESTHRQLRVYPGQRAQQAALCSRYQRLDRAAKVHTFTIASIDGSFADMYLASRGRRAARAAVLVRTAHWSVRGSHRGPDRQYGDVPTTYVTRFADDVLPQMMVACHACCRVRGAGALRQYGTPGRPRP